MQIPNKDQNIFQAYILLITLMGLAICVFCLVSLPYQKIDWEFLVIAAITVGIGSRVSIGIKNTRTSVSVSDVFTLLVFVLYGAGPAVILGSFEAYFSSSKHTQKKSLQIFNSAVLAISFFVSFQFSQLIIGNIENFAKAGLHRELVLIMLITVVCHYFVNTFLIALSSAIRLKKTVLQIWKTHYFWMFVPFLASGSIALVAANMIQSLGFLSFLLILPIVGILYFSYQSHHEKLEALTMQAAQAEQHLLEMKQSEERFRSAFSNAPIGIGLFSQEGQWTQVNESLCQIFGFSSEEFLEKNLSDVVHPQDIIQFLTEIGYVIQKKKKTFQAELRYFNHKNEEIWTQTSISYLSDAENSRLICQIQDITARHKAEEKLRHDAFYDSLTDLANHNLFMKKLTESLLKAQKINHRFVVIFVDLDRFKLINDSLGHLIGDKLLIAVSKRLKKCLPPESTISRFGSDEFFILLEQEIEEEQLVLLLEEMQKQISLTYNIFGQDININSSFGVVYYDQEHQTAEDLLRDSGTALHIAKSQGRARFVIFNEDMRAKSLSQIQLEKDLQGAIERDELYLVYQPIVALENAKPVGFEALVRWQHPTLGLVSPTDFIPIAEENGMIVKIGKFVFGEACRQLQRWQSEFLTELPLTMSINLSAKQLLQQNLLTEVLETLETYGVSPNKIKLEITESVIVENTDVVISILKQFRAMGVKLSMDDFGTGYSSLSYLHRLPINTLKIDRSFVTQMSKKHESFEIIKTIIFLAQNLDLEVVAEGIETAEQHEVLTKLGCQLGQGYYFSKPLNVADADKFINDSFTDINRVIAQPIEYRLSSKFEN